MVHRLEGFSILLQGGRIDRAEESYERMRQLVEPLGRLRGSLLDPMGLDARVDARLLLSGAQSLRGLWREARRNGREALDMMRKTGASPLSQLFVLIQLAAIHQARLEVHRVLELLEESIALSQAMSHRPTQTLTSVLEGWALVRSGRKHVDLERLRRGLEQMRGTRSWAFVYVLGLLADMHLVLGQVREGLELVEEALRLVDVSGGYFMEAELHRLRGELLRMAGQEDEALRCFLRARVRAHRQLAVLFELRATVSLGRQLRDLGRPGRVREKLERVLSRMEPDPDSVDFQQARELLDSLPPGDSGS
jgi:tetratricopeptide (TPR) repeat protein